MPRRSNWTRRRSACLRLTRLEDRTTPALNPAQTLHAYGFDLVAKVNGTTLDGANQTIAIVDAFYDPTAASDLATFDAQYGLPAPPNFWQVGQTGGSPTGYAQDSGWAGETALDIEWAHAIAPKANILLVESQDNGGSLYTAVDFARGATADAQHRNAAVSVVSMSWGGGEQNLDSHFITPSGHTGVSFFASSGDTASEVLYPSSSKNVVSVGGTNLQTSGTNGTYSSESAWSSGGGGPSTLFTKPSYQTAYSGTMRGTPDVAYDSDPNTGFSVYSTTDGGWVQFGGTSDAAPQWAALVALDNEGRVLSGLTPLDGPGQLLPELYTMPASNF